MSTNRAKLKSLSILWSRIIQISPRIFYVLKTRLNTLLVCVWPVVSASRTWMPRTKELLSVLSSGRVH